MMVAEARGASSLLTSVLGRPSSRLIILYPEQEVVTQLSPVFQGSINPAHPCWWSALPSSSWCGRRSRNPTQPGPPPVFPRIPAGSTESVRTYPGWRSGQIQ